MVKAWALSLSIAAALLAACGSQPPIAPGAMPQSRTTAQHANHGGSWMLPEASQIKKLLYISDGASDNVYVYNYKTSRLVGKLTGLQHPYGECVDADGNVWVSDLAGQAVVKYPRGRREWTTQLTTQGSAVGCSVDPTTGNLAVANVTTPSGAGDIRVFTSSGYNDYSNTDCYYLEQPGYDNAGNLYVEAYSSTYTVNVCELPHGGTSLTIVSVSRTIYGPGSVMWDGKYLTLTDELYNDSRSTAILRTKAASSGDLTVVGTTILSDTCDGDDAEVWQPFIVGRRNTPENEQQGNDAVGFDTDCTLKRRSSTWRYPSGGAPTRTLRNQPKAPDGNAVSVAPSR